MELCRPEQDCVWALGEIARYVDAQPLRGSPEGDRCDVMAALTGNHEAKHWPIAAPAPVEAIRARMQQAGYLHTDLAALFGSKSPASDVLGRRRPPTMDQAHRPKREWRIPAEVLLQPYHVKTA